MEHRPASMLSTNSLSFVVLIVLLNITLPQVGKSEDLQDVLLVLMNLTDDLMASGDGEAITNSDSWTGSTTPGGTDGSDPTVPESQPTSTEPEPTPPEPPTKLALSFINYNEFSVAWTASIPAVKHDVWITNETSHVWFANNSDSGLYINIEDEDLLPWTQYTIHVGDAAHPDYSASLTFWTPAQPPSRPLLSKVVKPEQLQLSWRRPQYAIDQLLLYRLRVRVNGDLYDDSRELIVGAGTTAYNICTSARLNYSIELRASHSYPFGDIFSDSPAETVDISGCMNASWLGVALNYDVGQRAVSFKLNARSFSKICDFGTLDRCTLSWGPPDNESERVPILWSPQDNSLLPVDSNPVISCVDNSDFELACIVYLEKEEDISGGERQLIVHAFGTNNEKATVKSRRIFVAKLSESSSSVLPWLLFSLVVTMAALALLYKKREPLWALATDIIQNAFHGRGHHYPDMEMPRLRNFKPADLHDARRFCLEFDDKKKDSHFKLAMEFHEIEAESEKYLNNRNMAFASLADVRPKNRYRDVVPYEHNRVHLQSVQGNPVSTYINASNINDLKGRARFIATQGPTKDSLEDFLRMLVEKNVKVVVTIISSINIVEEMQKRQCYQYWPHAVGASEPQGRYVVHLEAESRRSSFISRILKIIGPNSTTHRFKQLHYFEWKDHRTPGNPDDMISFLSVFRRAREGIPVVHCSAGVGRTGSFIALDLLMDALEEGVKVNIAAVVKHLRTQRMLMVQTEEQYIFLYECINTLLRQCQTVHQVNNNSHRSNSHSNNNNTTHNGSHNNNGLSAISSSQVV